jgi:hypothetical protein
MKYLRLCCATVVLMLSVVLSALAGQMDCPGIVQPSPPATATGQMPSGDISIGDMPQPLTARGEMGTGAIAPGELDCPVTAILLLSLTLGL